MKYAAPSLLLAILMLGRADALPNTVFGDVVLAESPLDGVDLTGRLLAESVWKGAEQLPGEWRDEGRVVSVGISHLLAKPALFGQEVLLLRAHRRDGTLEALEATFIDAGSYFGYFEEKPPAGASRREAEEEIRRRLELRQSEFSRLYADSVDSLRQAITAATGNAKPKVVRIGRTRTLRMDAEEWQVGNLTIRLMAADQRLVRLTVQPTTMVNSAWMDRSLDGVPHRDRLAAIAGSVRREEDGTVAIRDLLPIPQGFQPYCGLNTLAMVARHLGMHLDEDWLAVAGQFQNTGSAQGSNMLRLYQSVAAEAGVGMERKSALDPAQLRRSIDHGLPVIVWRRFSRERNTLHDRFLRQFQSDPSATLPDPGLASEQAQWPDENAPLHASVVVGYHPERKEILFLESWTGRDTPRRMRVEELAATTYLSFAFTP